MSIARNAPKEDDFESIRLISNGAYGAVYLVRHKKTRQRFALKKMKKTTLLLRNQVDQVYAERDILTFTDNPFVVCFYGSFETKQHLCMLMEYVEGEIVPLYSNLLGLCQLNLPDLHRDLKPDNLLITAMGHIKLTDFGLSKIGLMNRTTLDNQLCGTPEYIAPEVILRQGYGKPVDWWALGIILYEFLIGIVPFMGDSPEELFANIINEEVDYPTGEESLDSDAESLIHLLLEKNPVDRLGTIGGASQVTSHPFFIPMDFDSLLRQKAEFIPQLENEEDTSYFDSRTDRYNHEAESADEESANVPMFWSFSTASPRHSIVGMDGLLPPGSLANLQAIAAEAAAAQEKQEARAPNTQDFLRKFSSAAQSSEDGSCGTPSTTGSVCQQSAFSTVRQQRLLSDSQDSQCLLESGRLPPSSGSVGARSLDGSRLSDTTPIPSAVILRRRFSTQRHANLSTSSSGTGPINTCSSTDSSMDASSLHFMGDRRANLGNNLASPLPRFAISPCEQRFGAAERHDSGGAELSPVEESGVSKPGGSFMEKRPSTVVHELITDSANKAVINRSTRSASCRSDSLRVVIPSQYPSSSTSNSPAGQTTSQGGTCYYHSYTTTTTNTAGSSGQLSPSCNSVSSISSFDSQSPNPSQPTNQVVETSKAAPVAVSSSSLLLLPTSAQSTNLAQPAIYHPPPPSSSSKPIVIRKGLKGFGFTIRSVRVYLSQDSEYYTIEHIVAAVREPSPAFEAGLRENDLITHIHTQSVHNMTHPQLMHRLLSCGNEITLHVVPLNNTSIKEGDARKNVGKLLRKKPKKPQRRAALDKKPRKSSALLRRLSGKRAAGDIVPGTSSQKQTFMPRSVSSQEGVLNVSPACPANTQKSSQLLAEPSGLAVQQPTGAESGATCLSTTATGTSKLPHIHKHSAETGSSRSGQIALHQKRLSDFGIASSTEGSNFHHQQQQSPLVASSTSACSTITLSKAPSCSTSSNKYANSQPVEIKQTESSTTEAAPPSRPSTLQGLKNKVSQHLTASNQTSSSGTSQQQPLTRKVSGGGGAGCGRIIPLSPLARQSSGSVSAGSQPIVVAPQQPVKKAEVMVKVPGKAAPVAVPSQTQTKPVNTVNRIVNRFEEEGSVSNRQRSGRPRKTRARGDRRLVKIVKDDPRKTATDVRIYANNNLSLGIATRTARRIFDTPSIMKAADFQEECEGSLGIRPQPAPRKMSPSRIVQRFFRGASKDVSSSQGDPGSSGK
uniref:non-specific serine/threonine protein kinase n=1 Tax=Ditylenchus dipsaci TaxID=166011 RepID=A0A915CP68_9BILA